MHADHNFVVRASKAESAVVIAATGIAGNGSARFSWSFFRLEPTRFLFLSFSSPSLSFSLFFPPFPRSTPFACSGRTR